MRHSNLPKRYSVILEWSDGSRPDDEIVCSKAQADAMLHGIYSRMDGSDPSPIQFTPTPTSFIGDIVTMTVDSTRDILLIPAKLFSDGAIVVKAREL